MLVALPLPPLSLPHPLPQPRSAAPATLAPAPAGLLDWAQLLTRLLSSADVGLDAGWQACGEGVNGSYHNATTGHVIVDSNFPDMRTMTDRAHSLGLTASWYLNADGCESQSNLSHTYYAHDSNDAVHKFNCDLHQPPCWCVRNSLSCEQVHGAVQLTA